MLEEDMGINHIISAANRHDRLKLLHDPAVLDGNLNNPVHPFFHGSVFLEKSIHLKQAMQLASLFLTYDSVLEFFIPLLYGQTQKDSATGRYFLTNPIASKSDAEVKLYIEGVRQSLHCLQHCVTFCWMKARDDQRLWARTTVHKLPPAHTSDCFNGFSYKHAALIEMNEKFLRFYEDEIAGYATVSRCDQFRHDFQLAISLVHELVHAFGVARRGTLHESYIRLEHPDHEWGYAWENFMFGAIINPQDSWRSKLGTNVQLRKTWTTFEHAKAKGGKEYCAIPMSWIAQWFRQETWKKIEKGGPLSVQPSTVHLKICSSTKYSRWLVITDIPETRSDIEKIYEDAKMACEKDKFNGRPFRLRDIEIRRVLWTLVSSDSLQQSNVPIPIRIPPRLSSSPVAGCIASKKPSASQNSGIDSGYVSSEAPPAKKPTRSSERLRKRANKDEATDSARPRKKPRR